MDSLGVLPPSIDVRHEPASVLPPMPTSKPHNPLKTTSGRRSEFICGPNVLPNFAAPSRHMIPSPLRTCTPIAGRIPPPPPIDTSVATSSRRSPRPLERVPTEPGSAPPPRQQPTADELAVLGIKVRDFALEPSTLPRVPTVRKPFLRDLKRQREDTAEELDARRLNEARRLEFNTPRRMNGIAEERDALRLAFSSPRFNGMASNSFATLLGLPNCIEAGPNSISAFGFHSGPSSASFASPRTRVPLQRQPSEIYAPRASPGSLSTDAPASVLFGSLTTQHASLSSSPCSSDTGASQVQRAFTSSPLPRLDLDWLTRSFRESQSQFFQFESQSESQSQSQDVGTSSQSPGLSTSQADSEMDDEEYVKTPLVTPNGSLIFEDDHFDFPLRNSVTYLDTNRTDLGAAGSSSDGYEDASTRTSIPETNSSIIDSSAMHESQVAELLTPIGTVGLEEDVSASQMGLESQDLLSQPVWQQQSQPQVHSSQIVESQESQVEDVEMPASQPENGEGQGAEADRSLTPTVSLARTSSIFLSPTPVCISACSNHVASSAQPRPIPHITSHPANSHHASTSQVLSSSPSHSLLGRTPSSCAGLTLSRHPSVSSINGKTTSSASPTPLGKGRYNLRTPSPKKARLFGSPSTTSLSTPGHRARSRTQSSPASKRNAARVVSAAVVRMSKSAAQLRKRTTRGGKGEKGDADADIVMDDGGNVGQTRS